MIEIKEEENKPIMKLSFEDEQEKSKEKDNNPSNENDQILFKIGHIQLESEEPKKEIEKNEEPKKRKRRRNK
jgi:hypothetical protein